MRISMCGIAAGINAKREIPLSSLERRGPDVSRRVGFPAGSHLVELYGAVLHLQGAEISTQPVENKLLWNGEVYDGLERDLQESDTLAVFRAMETLCGASSSNREFALGLREVLLTIKGPFALIYWNERLESLWFARDFIGRRSLVLHQSDQNELVISSIASPELEAIEVDTAGIYAVDLDEDLSLHLLPWDSSCVELSPWTWNQEPIESKWKPFQRIYDSKAFDSTLASDFVGLLAKSMERRLTTIATTPSETRARVAILFSGGIDSLLLAALAGRLLPEFEPIDLINVAFGEEAQIAPDRLTGINGLVELSRMFPSRKWNLIEIDVDLEQVESSRPVVVALLKPASTVMDFNIGTILWHAARGEGRRALSPYESLVESKDIRYALGSDKQVEDSGFSLRTREYIDYKSESRVLLSGLGADELCAGYARHKTCFRKLGLEGLGIELEKDMSRLWKRNLGRDDRLCSDHGRELRHPFLDEDLVRFVCALPVNQVSCLHEPAGVGDKKILRHAALLLGLSVESCSLEKRAIQFGTRIANRRVAGYVSLTHDIKTSEIVKTAESKKTSCLLSKRDLKQRGKPGF